ncbi:DNA polymerase III subunit gamma/tau [Pelistega ratti]|uniref:DNA polymerase III subunit gamma/tau n=1 Tax=Pelistega ratti TaxID=2652177 RepID=UPI00135764E7|nr:DNA polymerase III subunit gamma/tau [Pelistega ratti]
MTTDNYLVLARKWRPRTFETLVGQDHVVKALSNALSTQRLHHAWLFTGTRGVGKTTLARILAKSLNCEKGISPHPCGTCQACVEIDQGRFVDYLEFDAASNRRVEEMTQLLEQAIYAPSVGRFKIYTIDEVHMLTGHAFNAMLKTLEEPPPHVKFILATTDPQKIPVTVLSRCLQFNLKQMAPESIVSHLQNLLGQEAVAYENEGLRLLAQAASGSMRDALSLTDQAIAYSGSHITAEAVRDMLGTIDQRYLVRLLQQLLAGNAQGLVDVATELTSRGFSFSSALEDFASLLSRIAIEQRLPGTIGKEDPSYADIIQVAQVIQPDVLQLFYSIAIHSRAELALSPDEYTGFIMAGLRMLSLVAPTDMLMPSVSYTPVEPVNTVAVEHTAQEVEQSSVVDTVSAITSTDQVIQPVVTTGNDVKQAIADEEKVAIVSDATNTQASPEPVEPAYIEPQDKLSSVDINQAKVSEDLPPWEEVPAEKKTLENPVISSSIDIEQYDGAVIDTPVEEDIALVSTWDDDLYLPVERVDDSSVPMQDMDTFREVEDTYTLESMTPERWVEIVKSLHLTGITGEIARHTEWIGIDQNTILLRLLVRLPNNMQAVEKLNTALTEYFKRIVKLKLEVGQTDQTVYAQDQQVLQVRQQMAEQNAYNDTLVKALQADFQATIVPDSIRPLVSE